jgi:two-component system, NtrC family, nitrogen regulation sensor histidine kinase NtrY
MRRLSHDARVFWLSLGGAAPLALSALWLLWEGSGPVRPRVGAGLAVLVLWLAVPVALRRVVVRPLQTLANLLAALRERDFTFRARTTGRHDPLDLVMTELNSLSETLRAERLGAVEATALLHKVMEEMEVAVMAFDGHRVLRLVNRAGARLLGREVSDVLGRSALELGVAPYLDGETPRLVEAAFPGGVGRWEVRRGTFRQEGRPHELLVLADLSRALRAEEREAWQRLVRVLGHEINNSLAPIHSIAGSLGRLLAQDRLADDWREDLTRGLGVIAARSDALNRFVSGYARLAKLPAPRLEDVDLEALVHRVVSLETRLSVAVMPSQRVSLRADRALIEQLLINLVRNAADAALETGGGVQTGWRVGDDSLELVVEDEGPGLTETANLFVPFFTTKPGGSGIGLVLARQVAESHGGALILANRSDRRGCRALLRLPMPQGDSRR